LPVASFDHAGIDVDATEIAFALVGHPRAGQTRNPENWPRFGEGGFNFRASRMPGPVFPEKPPPPRAIRTY
jgi:hypothetical protein